MQSGVVRDGHINTNKYWILIVTPRRLVYTTPPIDILIGDDFASCVNTNFEQDAKPF